MRKNGEVPSNYTEVTNTHFKVSGACTKFTFCKGGNRRQTFLKYPPIPEDAHPVFRSSLFFLHVLALSRKNAQLLRWPSKICIHCCFSSAAQYPKNHTALSIYSHRETHAQHMLGSPFFCLSCFSLCDLSSAFVFIIILIFIIILSFDIKERLPTTTNSSITLNRRQSPKNI